MFRKNIYYLAACFFFSTPLAAQENLDQISSDKDDIIELSAPLYGKIKKSNIALLQEKYNKAFDDDERLALYLQTPYEKRQYVFPMIHAAPYISHKIKTHPEIIIWKNKKPTLIAPQLSEFSKKHLENLSPFYYIYLDPDFWNPPHPETKKIHSFNNPFAMLSEKDVDYVYPTLKQLFNLSDTTAQSYLQTTINENDIANLSNVIANLDSFQSNFQTKEEFAMKLINLQREQVNRAIADPFKMFILSLQKVGEKENFSSFLKQYNFSSPEEFAQKADLILKSFQILHLNLNAAIEINHNRYNYKITPLSEKEFGNKDITPIEMFSRLHQAKSGDVYFVRKYLPQLKNLFKTKFIERGIMIFVD